MLKAYSYIEAEYLDVGILDEHLFENEKQIILEFVNSNPTPMLETPCVVCGGAASRFAVVNGVLYQRCGGCLSIFARVERETAERYAAYKPLANFRDSPEYQGSAAEKRAGIWDEMLFWISYRLARYMPDKSRHDIIDVGNRYHALAEKIARAGFCASYNEGETAGVVLYLDQLRGQADPMGALLKLRGMLKDGGLLIMSARAGSGFDILTLKGCTENIFPYETIFLPSIEGLSTILRDAGFDILEISTPGALDIERVLKFKDKIDPGDFFVHYLLNKTDRSVLAEFQHFLQKSGISSYARVIARKKP